MITGLTGDDSKERKKFCANVSEESDVRPTDEWYEERYQEMKEEINDLKAVIRYLDGSWDI